MGFRRLAIASFLLCLFCATFAKIFVNSGIITISWQFIYLPLPVFLILGTLINYFLIGSLSDRPQKFINAFLLGLTIKMFAHLLILVFVDFTFPKSAIQFTIIYAVYYLLFTITEVTLLYNISRKQLN